jgi:DNA processing protein
MDQCYLAAWGALQKLTYLRYQKIRKQGLSLKAAWNINSVFDLKQLGLDDDFIVYFLDRKKKINPEQEWEKLLKQKINIISIADLAYSPLLKEISPPPVFLYTKGKVNFLTPKTIAVVGTRNNSVYGQQVTEQLITELVQQQFTIVSGLALGIDSIAHQTTLNNQGTTWAVLAGGLDTVYPQRHRYLADKIIETGALISELPPGGVVQDYHFPQRNRIVSGLSLGTVVIEAGEKSGALITAKMALEQNRDVFAIPGSLFSLKSIGTNNLISKGEGKLVTKVKDILDELNLNQTLNKQSFSFSNPLPQFNDTLEEKIYHQIQNQSGLIDDLVTVNQKSISELSSKLTRMEIQGMIKNMGNGVWAAKT